MLVPLGAEIVQVAGIQLGRREWLRTGCLINLCKVGPIDVVAEMNGVPGKVLHDSEAAVGRHNESLTIPAKYHAPELVR
jgi:hypothetical protein